METEKKKIIDRIEEYVQKKDTFSSSDIQVHVPEVSRQYISRIITEMIKANILEKKGLGRYTIYFAKGDVFAKSYHFDLSKYSGEDAIYRQLVDNESWILDMDENTKDKFRYISTEMINNVIDHSQAGEVYVHVEYLRDIDRLVCSVIDKGIGIFEKVRNTFNLKNHNEALEKILEGKTTTDSENHSGEGMFFSSKIADTFHIISAELALSIDNKKNDYALEKSDFFQGTNIRFEIDNNNITTMRDVFNRYTDEDYRFNTTKIVIELYSHGESFVSRSEAKRLLSNLAEKFNHIIFDYQDVKKIGQGFSDEIYRVFHNNHPQIKIESRNVNDEIDFMIKRSQV